MSQISNTSTDAHASAKPDNPPAFPTKFGRAEYASAGGAAATMAVEDGGMTLRDYFAAAVLPEIFKRHIESPSRTAEVAYEFAGALLKARTK